MNTPTKENTTTPEKTRSNFCMKKFVLTVNFEIDKIKDPKNIDDLENYCILLHEYTHYLQSFCTFAGASALFDFFCLQDTIIQETRNEILKSKNYDTQIFSKFRGQYTDIWYKNNGDKDITTISDASFPNYTIKIKNVITQEGLKDKYFIKLDSDIYNISGKMLKETMAMMSMYAVKKIPKSEIVNIFSKKQYSGLYTYLFLYFYKKYPKINDLVRFTYQFSELCLQSVNTEDMINKVLSFLDDYYPNYENSISFLNLFYKKHPEIKTIIHNKVNEIFDKIDELKSRKENEYYKIVIKYLELLAQGLVISEKYDSLFTRPMDKNFLEHYAKFVSSPIIVESLDVNDEKKYILKTLDNSRSHDDLALLYSISIILDQYITEDKDFSKCPFLNAPHICKIQNDKKIIEDVCEKDPYCIKTFSDGGNCLFYNANKIFGFLPADEINKFVKL